LRIAPTSWAKANLTGIREVGKSLEADCPFCGKKGHFYLHRERGYFTCFARDCGVSGRSLIALIAKIEGVPISEVRERLFRETVSFSTSTRPATPEDTRGRILALQRRAERTERGIVDIPVPRATVPVWDGKRWRMPSYLSERQLTRRLAQRYGIGYCGDDLCSDAPEPCTFPAGRRTCIEIGRCRYAGRIILPFSCPNGRSFTARTMESEVEPKYLNPPGPKGRLLYGWVGVQPESEIVLVEGPFDALRLASYGLSALALMGISMTLTQLTLIASPRPVEVTVMLDANVEREAVKIATNLLGVAGSVYLAKLEGAKDPGDSTREQALIAVHGAERFTGARSRVARSLRNRLEEQRNKILAISGRVH
jgi:DNA primase